LVAKSRGSDSLQIRLGVTESSTYNTGKRPGGASHCNARARLSEV
jgi:hypothetical protein